ncbi:MAG: hypothetical protein P8J24_10250, partial [Arenicellales bacterium]|nr:hypothetical protein [Arenicellales bacterium]
WLSIADKGRTDICLRRTVMSLHEYWQVGAEFISMTRVTQVWPLMISRAFREFSPLSDELIFLQ